MLKHMGPQEWFHDEYKNINKMQFQYKDKGSPLDYVNELSPYMTVSILYYCPIHL